MSATGLDVFDKTIHETNHFVKIVMRELNTGDRRIGYSALRGALHGLRDHLDLQNIAHLSAQLPMLLRGLFFEGWNPVVSSTHERHLNKFLNRVSGFLPPQLRGYAEEASRATFVALAECLDEGETEKLIRQMPRELRELWPEPIRTSA